MSFRIKRKISAPGRLGTGSSRTHSNSLLSPTEEDEVLATRRKLMGRKHSVGYERRRVFDHLKVERDFIKEVELHTQAEDEEVGITNNNIQGKCINNKDSLEAFPTDPGEVTLYYLVQDFMQSAKTKIEHFCKLVGVKTVTNVYLTIYNGYISISVVNG